MPTFHESILKDSCLPLANFEPQQNLGRIFSTSKMHLSSPSGVGCCPFEGGEYVVVDLMYFPLFVRVLCLSLLCYAIVLKRTRKLVALLLLSYRCIVTTYAMWLFFTVP